MKKYLHFIEQAQRIHDQHGLTRHEVALLDLSAKRHLINESITAGEFMRQGEIASQVTLRIAFKSLVAKRLLTTKHRKEDGRVKQVVLTKLALEHYKKLDRAISRLP